MRFSFVTARAIVYATLVGVLLLQNACKTSRNSGPRSSQQGSENQSAREELRRRNLAFDADTFVQTAAAGDMDAVGLFLRAGMHPEVTNKYGFTALMWSAGQDREAVVQLLINEGA